MTLTVRNRLPNLSAQSGSEGQGVSLSAEAMDFTGTDTFTYSASGLPSGLSINPTSGLISGIPGYANASAGLTASFVSTLTLRDSGGGTETYAFSWLVADVNRLPNLAAQNSSEGQAVSLSAQATDNTGTNSLTYSASGLPAGLSVNPSNGLIGSYVGFDAVTAGPSATYSTTLTLTDGNGGTDSTGIVWTIQDALLFANADSYSLHFDMDLRAGVGLGVLGNDRASATGSLSASVVSGPAHGSLSLNSDGSFLYTPSAGYAGADNFSYLLTDGASNTATGTAYLSITDDHPPVASNDTYSVQHDQDLFVDASEGVLANDSDGDVVDALTASLVASVSHGTLALSADGSFLYTPSAGFVGTDSFTYAASDGLLQSATRTVTIQVSDSVPVAVNDSYGVHTDVAQTVPAVWGVLANDSDPDEGDSLSATVVSGPSHGTLSLAADGSFVYSPSASYSGPDSFTYAASDGAQSVTATVTLNVHSSNATPSASANAYTVQHDQVLSVPARSTGLLINDSDADGDVLSASLGASPSHGTVTLSADGSFVYTPDAGYVGSDSFTYTASDGVASSGAATVSLTVTNPNSPAGVSDSYDVGRNNPRPIPQGMGVLVNDSDDDYDVLTAGLVNGPSHGTLSLNADGSFVYTPDNNYTGPDSFTYSVSDGATVGATVTVNLSVTAGAPSGYDDSYGIAKNGTLSVASSGVLFNDVSPGGLSITASLGASVSHGSLTLNANGSFVYVPDNNYTGDDSFTYTASDGSLSSDPVTVSLSVHDGNSAPSVTDVTATIGHDSALSDNVLGDATDADDDPLMAEKLSDPDHGTLSFNVDGSFDYTPSLGYVGTDSFTFRVFDGTTYSGTATYSLSITQDAPTATADVYSVLSSGTTSVDEADGLLINDSDPEGDSLSATLVSGPSSGSLTLHADGSFDYTAGGGFIDSDSFTYKVSDGVSDSSPVTVTLTRGPVAAGDYFAVGHDRTLEPEAGDGVLANDRIAAGVSLTASLSAGVSHGTLTLNSDGSFVYSPTAGYVGSDSFTYTVTGDGLTSAPITVSLDVVQSEPEAGDDGYHVNQDDILIVDLTGGLLANDTDEDNDNLTARLLTAPQHGTAALRDNGALVYVPAPGFFGVDTFTYEASDGLDTSTATVTIHVNQVITNVGVSRPVAVAIGDFDEDDHPDAVIADSGLNQVAIHLNDGAGGLSQGVGYAVGNAPSAVAVADFNGDDDLDLAVTNADSDTVTILLGNGDGTFQAPSSVSVGTDPSSLLVTDLDGDNEADLVVANAGSNTVTILLGNGDGTFQAPSSVGVGNSPSSVATADFNDDNDADLVVANPGSHTVYVLLGQGDGTFLSPVSIALTGSPTSVVVGDFDDDGSPDLAVAREAAAKISVLFNDGDGTFTTSKEYTAGVAPVAVAPGDFNGDGSLDLSVADRDSDRVLQLVNVGARAFLAADVHEAVSHPAAIAVGDVDGDGVSDQVVALSDPGVLLIRGVADQDEQVQLVPDLVTSETGGFLAVYGSDARLIRIYDTTKVGKDRIVGEIKRIDGLMAMSISGNVLAVALNAKEVVCFNVSTGKRLGSVDIPVTPKSLAFSDDRKVLVVGYDVYSEQNHIGAVIDVKADGTPGGSVPIIDKIWKKTDLTPKLISVPSRDFSLGGDNRAVMKEYVFVTTSDNAFATWAYDPKTRTVTSGSVQVMPKGQTISTASAAVHTSSNWGSVVPYYTIARNDGQVQFYKLTGSKIGPLVGKHDNKNDANKKVPLLFIRPPELGTSAVQGLFGADKWTLKLFKLGNGTVNNMGVMRGYPTSVAQESPIKALAVVNYTDRKDKLPKEGVAAILMDGTVVIYNWELKKKVVSFRIK